MSDNTTINNNLISIVQRISDACQRVGRSRDEVTLICVSKMNPAEAVIEANDCGADTFGENKVQELTDKMQQVGRDLNWHLIGHLQTNKVKYVVGKVAMIHSVDSLRVAQAISREALKAGVTANILIEVNIALEESKFGVTPNECETLIRSISSLPNLKICGLMTVAPDTSDPESNRPYFRRMKELSVDIASQNIDNVSMNVLSMGMSGDFEVAVEEGATHVRIGTGIFGRRNYTI